MKKAAQTRSPIRRVEWQETTFTLDRARAALGYVARVLEDAVDAYRQAHAARNQLSRDCASVDYHAACRQRDSAIERLNRTIDECHAVGVAMLNVSQGSMGFLVNHDNKLMCVIWRLGDPLEGAWSTLDVSLPEQQSLYAARDA